MNLDPIVRRRLAPRPFSVALPNDWGSTRGTYYQLTRTFFIFYGVSGDYPLTSIRLIPGSTIHSSASVWCGYSHEASSGSLVMLCRWRETPQPDLGAADRGFCVTSTVI